MELDPGFAAISFIVGRCNACERQVLTYPDTDTGTAAGQMRCVHCDATVVAEIRTTDASELPEHGYGLLELQGCGSPDCGGGRCGRSESGD